MKESQQDKILAMWEDGMTCREMEEELGCSNGSIYSTLSKFHLKPHARVCPNCGSRLNIENTLK